MQRINLSKTDYTLVDASDYEYLSQFKWWTFINRRNQFKYARTKINNKYVYMHRLLLGLTDPKVPVDHINGNSLDNHRNNIRIATTQLNAANRGKQKNNTSGYKGVFKRNESYYQLKSKFRAMIRVNQKLIRLGTFDNPEDAARAYDRASREYFGEFGFLNFPNKTE